MFDVPPFPGFRDEAFDFLRGLAANNDRDWFNARKATYEDEVKWPMECLVVDAARRATERDLPLSGNPKQSLFRIYRDTRFSRNKQPYKTHAAAVLSRNGTRKDEGVVYIHVQPGQSFLGAGYWRPDMDLLRPWRGRIATDPAPFREVLQDLQRQGLTVESGETLTRMPRGFEEHGEADYADLLKWKSFTVRRPFPDEALQAPAFTDEVLRFAEDVLPLLRFGWDLLDTRDQPAFG